MAITKPNPMSSFAPINMRVNKFEEIMTIGELLKILKEYPEEWEISYNAYASYLALYLGDEEVVVIIPYPNYN